MYFHTVSYGKERMCQDTSEADQAAGGQEQQQQTSSTDLISDTGGIDASVP
jgi:hypothetical protein